MHARQAVTGELLPSRLTAPNTTGSHRPRRAVRPCHSSVRLEYTAVGRARLPSLLPRVASRAEIQYPSRETCTRMKRSWMMQLVCATAAVQLPARVTLPCGCPVCAATQLSNQIFESSDESQGSSNPSEAAVSALKFYKKVISPLIPPGCRFIPTCSECMRAQVFEPCLPAPTRMRCVIHAVLT